MGYLVFVLLDRHLLFDSLGTRCRHRVFFVISNSDKNLAYFQRIYLLISTAVSIVQARDDHRLRSVVRAVGIISILLIRGFAQHACENLCIQASYPLYIAYRFHLS